MDTRKVELEAHKGVDTEYPENTMAAFNAAVEQGYDMIELDPNYTLDRQFIVHHDAALNRCGRKLNGDKIEEEKLVAEMNYSELLNYEFGSSFDKKFLGEKAPLMTDVLRLAEETGIKLKIDNKFEGFPSDVKEEFLNLFKDTKARVGLTMANADAMTDLAERFPNLEFHYDGLITEEVLKKLSEKVGKDRLTVWIPYKNDRTWWVKVEYANKQLADNIKKYAKLGVWILTKQSEYEDAVNLGADVIETDGSLKPIKGE